MERFFEVKKDSELYNDYFEWLEDNNKVRCLYREFADRVGIKADEYIPHETELGIVPTSEDKEKFGKFLKVPGDYGVCYFKKNSVYTKDWQKEIKQRGCKVLRKPKILFYLSNCYKVRTRLFHINDKLYGSYDTEDEVKLPDSFIEMKASEFYQIIESLEEN